MQTNRNGWSTAKCALISAVCGVVVLLFLLWLMGFAFWASFFWGLVIAVVVFIVLMLAFGARGDEVDTHAGSGGMAAGAGTSSGGGAAATASAGASASAGGADEGSTADADEGSTADAVETATVAEEAPQGAEDAPQSESAVKPSAPLAGQDELAAKKGEWKYEGDAGADSADTGAGSSDAASADDALGEDYDGDGVREGTDEGTKPEMLSAARDGGADNLKEIKGVGPAMEKMLNGMGVYHFDQIAAWSADEVAWVDANLKGFKGRVSRDGWVDQAKILMTGAETEFSQRVEDGKVY